jgi:hypothetical protein
MEFMIEQQRRGVAIAADEEAKSAREEGAEETQMRQC